MKQKTIPLIALTCFIIMLNCAIELKYEKPTKSPVTNGPISVTVKDEREFDKGGSDHTIVGRVWNGIGMPVDQKVKPGREPAIIIKELLSDCLESSGYQIVDASKKVPILYAQVNEFRFIFRRARIKINLTLKYHENKFWEDSLLSSSNKLKSTSGQYTEYELNSALELLKQMLLTKYKSNEFQQGYAENKKMISE